MHTCVDVLVQTGALCCCSTTAPSVAASLLKDGISVLHCVLQHPHTHCPLLFASCCAQGNRAFININTLVSEDFVHL